MKKEKESIVQRTIYYLAFISSIVYIIYRIFFTVPNDTFTNIFFAILVLAVEIAETFFFAIHCFNVLIYKKESPQIPKIKSKDKYPEIDILIATINEEVELLEDTIKAIKKMKYPDKKKLHIYLCDDGRRKEMEQLCKKMRINYIKRSNNKDAKAGNYNNALKHTKSPYIATFDADMQPSPDFLMKTVPFLIEDKKVGFVQVPQSFRNPDIYQVRYKLIGKIPHEQDYFFDKIQAAKNKTNAVIYCGTNAVFLRKALKDAGGFATQSVTEDIATGIQIQAKGYKGISLSDKTAYGIAVNNLDSYIKQKSRWCRGCLQTFKNYSVIRNKGLTIRQKLDYLSTLFYWSFGFRQIFSIVIPLLFPLFGIKMIRSNVYIFVTLFFIQFIFKRFAVDFAEKNAVSSTWNRIYETILFPTIAIDLFKEIYNIGKSKFEVSPKFKEKTHMSLKNLYLLIVHGICFLVTLFALIVSIIQVLNSRFDFYIIPIFWLTSNLIYLTFALIFDLSLKEVEDIDVTDKQVNKYSITNPIDIVVNFIKEEVSIKKFATVSVALLMLVAALIGINIYKKQDILKIIEPNLVSHNGWLSIDEEKIVNENGEQIMLRGVNSHHIFSWGYLYDYNNLKTLKETWGVNIFRIAMYTHPEEEGYVKNKYLKDEVKRIVDLCVELDIYVIIDWHILHDNNPRTYEKEAIEFFDEMSKEYANVPNVLYEICNEPSGKEVTWDEVIKPYAENLIETIRKNSPKSIIIVGTANWSKDTESVINNPLEYKNITYAVHTYLGKDIYSVEDYIKLAIKEKLPIFITEVAATDGTGDGYLYFEQYKQWIEYLEQNNLSWIVWQLSDKFESSSLLIPKDKKDFELVKAGIYSKNDIERRKYDINNYLTETGEITRAIFRKYSLGIEE